MICTDCRHALVCAFRSDCEALQDNTKMYRLDERFTLEIKCKDKEVKPTVSFRTPSKLGSWQLP